MSNASSLSSGKSKVITWKAAAFGTGFAGQPKIRTLDPVLDQARVCNSLWDSDKGILAQV